MNTLPFDFKHVNTLPFDFKHVFDRIRDIKPTDWRLFTSDQVETHTKTRASPCREALFEIFTHLTEHPAELQHPSMRSGTRFGFQILLGTGGVPALAVRQEPAVRKRAGIHNERSTEGEKRQKQKKCGTNISDECSLEGLASMMVLYIQKIPKISDKCGSKPSVCWFHANLWAREAARGESERHPPPRSLSLPSPSPSLSH